MNDGSILAYLQLTANKCYTDIPNAWIQTVNLECCK